MACKIVVMGGSKGGCGRSTLARNLMVSAAQEGLKVVGIDLDPQGTLWRWSQRRARARETLPEIVEAEVLRADITDWLDTFRQLDSYDLAVIDTAPSVEHNMTSAMEMCRAANLVLVPLSDTPDDMESAAPWLENLCRSGSRGVFVLNRINPRTRSFKAARRSLLRYGPLAPVEIPDLVDIPAPSANGLAVADYESARGAEAVGDLWVYTRREIGL